MDQMEELETHRSLGMAWAHEILSSDTLKWGGVDVEAGRQCMRGASQVVLKAIIHAAPGRTNEMPLQSPHAHRRCPEEKNKGE